MTTLELKIKIKKDIDNEKDSAILKKLQAYYRRLKVQKNMPCQYTLEELKGRLKRGRQEMEKGGGTDHDEFMKEVETWF